MSKINYVFKKSDKENAPTLVFVPGSAEGIARFEPYIKMLLQDVNVMCFDNPGVGETPLFEFSAQSLADEYLKIIKSECISNFCLLGHSFGGFIAQEMALIAPDLIDRLVIISIGVGSFLQKDIVNFQLQITAGKVPMQDMFSADWVNENSEKMEAFITERSTAIQPATKMAYIQESSKVSTLTRVANIKVKTLVIQGVHDKIVLLNNGTVLAQMIPESELLFSNAAHYPYIEDSSIWAKIIDFCVNHAQIGEVQQERFEPSTEMCKEDARFLEKVAAEDYNDFIRSIFVLAATQKDNDTAYAQYIRRVHE